MSTFSDWPVSFFSRAGPPQDLHSFPTRRSSDLLLRSEPGRPDRVAPHHRRRRAAGDVRGGRDDDRARLDRKSTRLNSSHVATSYAVFCLKKKIRVLSDANGIEVEVLLVRIDPHY